MWIYSHYLFLKQERVANPTLTHIDNIKFPCKHPQQSREEHTASLHQTTIPNPQLKIMYSHFYKARKRHSITLKALL